MNQTKRIISLILLILSVFFFVVSLAGILLTWVYRPQVTSTAMSRLNAIEADLTTAQVDLRNAKAELESAQQQIDALQSALETLGLRGSEDIQAIGDLVGRLEQNLTPFIGAVAERVEGFREALVQLKETIERLNQLPLVNIDIPGIEQLEEATASLDNIYNQIIEGQEKVKNVSQLTQETVTNLTTGFAELETSAQTLSATLGAYDAKFTAYLAEIDYYQANLPGWINTAAVVLTVLLVWLAFSQAALFILTWSFYKEQDLLRRWRTDQAILLGPGDHAHKLT